MRRTALLFLLLASALYAAPPAYYAVHLNGQAQVTRYRATDSTSTTTGEILVPWIPRALAFPDGTPLFKVRNGSLLPVASPDPSPTLPQVPARQHPDSLEVTTDADGNVVSHLGTSATTPSTPGAILVPWVDRPIIDPDRTPRFRVINGALTELSQDQITALRAARAPKPADRRNARYKTDTDPILTAIVGYGVEMEVETDPAKLAALKVKRDALVSQYIALKAAIRTAIPDVH